MNTTALALVLSLVACGHVKAVETSLKVSTDRCKESGEQPKDTGQTWLDCLSGGEVSVRIELPRKVWHDLESAREPLRPSPGK
jgi:hypothetical protein